MRRVQLVGLVTAAGLMLLGCGATQPTASNAASASEVECASFEHTWKLAFGYDESHPEYIAAEQLARDLAARTDCRYTIEIYPNDLLGPSAEAVESLSAGLVEMMYVPGTALESVNPDFAVYNLPYLFDSVEAQTTVLGDDNLNTALFESLEETKSITVLGALFAGVGNIYATKPIAEPADLAGLAIGVESESQVAAINAMGGVATLMAHQDLLAALESGAIQGAVNTAAGYDLAGHEQFAPYYLDTPRFMAPDYLAVATKALNSMSATDQAVLRELANEARLTANERFPAFISDATAKAEARGATFGEVDTAAFVERLAAVHEQFLTTDYAQELAAAVTTANEGE